jgi:hypothetical protein
MCHNTAQTSTLIPADIILSGKNVSLCLLDNYNSNVKGFSEYIVQGMVKIDTKVTLLALMGDLRVTLQSENKPITLSLPHSENYLYKLVQKVVACNFFPCIYFKKKKTQFFLMRRRKCQTVYSFLIFLQLSFLDRFV